MNLTQSQFQKLLENPKVKVNEKYSQEVKKKPKRPKMATPPLKFYDEERPIKLFIPFVPPSLNRILSMNQWERRKLKEEFVNDMRWELMFNKVKCFKSPVSLIITLYYPVERRRDKDNYLKFLLDSLRGVLIIDDSPEFLKDVRVEFAKGKKHMEIQVIPIMKEAV